MRAHTLQIPHIRFLLIAWLAIWASGFSTFSAAEDALAVASARPRVALVLSGGGARGLAHIGVIRELERMRIPVDCIVGTSMGGVVGGVYAAGMPIAEMEQTTLAIDWTRAFQDRPDRLAMRARRKKDENGHFALPEFGVRNGEVVSPAGVIYGQNLSEVLNHLTRRAIGIQRFEQFPIPFKTVATDIATGHRVLLDSGPLPAALRATMSVPTVMAPVEVDDKLLIDGGLVDNLPVSTGRALCGDVVVAVNLGTPLLTRKEIGSAVSVGLQMVNILTEQNVRASLAMLSPGDVLVSPVLDALTSGSFDQAQPLFRAGEAAVRSVAAQLERLAVSPEQFALWKARHDLAVERDFYVDEIRIAPMKTVNPQVLLAEIKPENANQSANSLMDSTTRVFQRGDFERVQLNFSQEDGKNIALLEPKEKSWGPDYLRFGLSMTAQTGERTSFNMVLGYTRTWLNRYGARWQNVLQVGEKNAVHSEFLQPLALDSPWFVAPRFLASVEQSPVYFGQAQVARITRTQNLMALEAGTELGKSGDVRIGAEFGRENYQIDIGPAVQGTDWAPLRAITARLDFDTLDKAHFPTQGYRAVLDVHQSSSALGAKTDYLRTSMDLTAVQTWQQNTFNMQWMYGTVEHNASVNESLFDLIPMGGFQRLSGYPVGRFRVDQLAFVRLGYQRNIAPVMGLTLGGIVSQTYFGASLEAAQLRQTYDVSTANGLYKSAALFIGADTLLGPTALSLGVGENGQRALWFSVGVPWTLK
jgi:NTE family protein